MSVSLSLPPSLPLCLPPSLRPSLPPSSPPSLSPPPSLTSLPSLNAVCPSTLFTFSHPFCRLIANTSVTHLELSGSLGHLFASDHPPPLSLSSLPHVADRDIVADLQILYLLAAKKQQQQQQQQKLQKQVFFVWEGYYSAKASYTSSLRPHTLVA